MPQPHRESRLAGVEHLSRRLLLMAVVGVGHTELGTNAIE